VESIKPTIAHRGDGDLELIFPAAHRLIARQIQVGWIKRLRAAPGLFTYEELLARWRIGEVTVLKRVF